MAVLKIKSDYDPRQLDALKHIQDKDLFIFREMCISLIRKMSIEDLKTIFRLEKEDPYESFERANIPEHVKKELKRNAVITKIVYKAEVDIHD